MPALTLLPAGVCGEWLGPGPPPPCRPGRSVWQHVLPYGGGRAIPPGSQRRYGRQRQLRRGQRAVQWWLGRGQQRGRAAAALLPAGLWAQQLRSPGGPPRVRPPHHHATGGQGARLCCWLLLERALATLGFGEGVGQQAGPLLSPIKVCAPSSCTTHISTAIPSPPRPPTLPTPPTPPLAPPCHVCRLPLSW